MFTEGDIALLGAGTTLCISLAERPSTFGITVHNAGYRALGLNFLYKAIRPNDLSAAIAGIRGLGIRGCGVSMPYKIDALTLVDEVEAEAVAVGAINTIVNNDGHLKGFNTDVSGARRALADIDLNSDDKVLLLGAGGVARAILHALVSFPVADIAVAARREEAVNDLRTEGSISWVPWAQRDSVESTVLINATPIGMVPDIDEMPVSVTTITRNRAIFDVVANPPVSRLISEAQKIRGKISVSGLTMALYQAADQFCLYTGCEPPLDAMRAAAEKI